MAKIASPRQLVRLGLAATVLTIAAVAATNASVLANATIYPRTRLADVPVLDVAIVPGCHADNGRPAPMLEARLAGALELLRAGRVRRILVTGNARSGETAAMTSWLEARDVSPLRILVDDAGFRTIESVQHAGQVFGIKSAVICTQRLHQSRALFLARAGGIDAVGFESDFDASGSVRWRAIEALKRTLAFTEVRVLHRLQAPPATVALNR